MLVRGPDAEVTTARSPKMTEVASSAASMCKRIGRNASASNR